MSPEAVYGEDDLALVVARLHQDLDELKGRQRVAWANLRTYKQFSSGQYDISQALTQGQSKRFLITFTFANATGGAIMEMNAFYRLDNPAVMASPMERRASTNPNIDVRWRKTAAANTYATWELVIVNTASVVATYTGYVKLFFDGTDTGTFIVQEL